jgi:release factor glutamine methyltransferase
MLEWGTDYLHAKDIASPRLSMEYLVAELLQLKRLQLYLQFDRPLSTDQLDALKPMIKALVEGQPLQYVLGNQPFCGLSIKVDSRALIPRPETEELVYWILEHIEEDRAFKLLDLGSGSGCIPLAIKHNRAHCLAVGLDVSEQAISLAKENAQQLNLDVRFVKGDFTQPKQWPKEKKLDFIVSNPPYIHPKERNSVDDHVHGAEPHLALYTEDVVKTYKEVLTFSAQHIHPEGHLFLEMNPLYSDFITQAAKEHFVEVQTRNDMADKVRFLHAVGLK